MGKMKTKPTFLNFCIILQRISETRSTSEKQKLFSHYLRNLKQSADVQLACQFVGEGAFSNRSGTRSSVGGKTIANVACSFCEIPFDPIFRACRTATGSTSEAIEKLCENLPSAQARYLSGTLVLSQIQERAKALRSCKNRSEKEAVLFQTWRELSPLEIKYFLRLLTQGSLRIGFETRSILHAIAICYEQSLEKLRYVHMITGSIGETAFLAFHNELEKASFSLFRPIAFMLASPFEEQIVNDFKDYVLEEKFDGMRAQLHSDGKTVRLYSRDLNEITHSFSDVVTHFQEKELSSLVLDGELLAFKDGRILSFQHLQQRMGRKKPSSKILRDYPVLFIAYDILFLENELLVKEPLSFRRSKLEDCCARFSIAVSVQESIADLIHLEKRFKKALANGNEGLMLKKSDSFYEFGQRKKTWLKVKEPVGSLDTVIMYAHAGSGKRGGLYSDFTLGIRVKEDERYEEEFIPIGKAYGGYSNQELKHLNTEIKKRVIERFGSTLSLKTELVVEIEFDAIQINKRTKAKYTLRFPRFKRLRPDLSPDDCNSLRDVERLYTKRLYFEPEKQSSSPSFFYPPTF